jgi:cysteine desulfurase
LNLSFPGIEAEALMEALPHLCMSTASACTSASLQPSYVLGALGLSDEQKKGSLRLSLGRFTTDEEIDRAIAMIGAAASRLQRER